MDDKVEDILARRTALSNELSSMQNRLAVAKDNENRLKNELMEVMVSIQKDFKCNNLEEAEARLKEMLKEASSSLDAVEGSLNAVRNL